MKYLLLSLFVVTASAPALAQYDLTKRFGVGGGAGWNFPLWKNRFDNAAESGGTYNFHVRYNTSARDGFQISYTPYEFDDVSVRAKVWDVMYLQRLKPTARWSPVWGIGVGLAELANYQDDDNWHLAAKARIGVQYAITQNLYASVDVDYQWIDYVKGKTGVANLGAIHTIAPQANLTWYFGDGAGGSVAKTGAGAAGAGTIASHMDKSGQAEVEVHFASGSSAIDYSSRKNLEELANYLEANPSKRIEIQGHTDSTGSSQINSDVSSARAESVKKYLEDEYGISASRLNARGYGEAQPIGDNTTPEGRAENRRVMILSI